MTSSGTLSTILKRLYSFAQILGQASEHTASLWDVTSLDKARRWAAYCEKVHAAWHGKAVVEGINRKLLEMSLMLDPPGSVCVSMEILGNATELLTQTLLQNQHTSTEVVNRLIAQQDSKQNEMSQMFSDLIAENPVLSADLLGCLDGEAKTRCKQLARDRRVVLLANKTELRIVTAQTEVVFRYLVAAARHRTDDDFVSHVEQVVERVQCLKKGWEILVCTLSNQCTDTEQLHDEPEIVDTILVILGAWICKQADSDMHRALWDVPYVYLSKAAASNHNFCALYLGHLTSLANQMEPHYHSRPIRGCLYSWRTPGSNTDDLFDSLTAQFQCLLDRGGDIRRSTIQTLNDRAHESYFNIWRNVCRKLH